ncbi:unnamed protein product [Camellia sinensis]
MRTEQTNTIPSIADLRSRVPTHSRSPNVVMSRRQTTPSQRLAGSGPFGGIFHPKSRVSPLLSVVLIIVGVVLLIGLFRGGSGIFAGNKEAISKVEGDYSCTLEVHMGLRNRSFHFFLWALRKPTWAIEDLDSVPIEFTDRTLERGRVSFGRAPQREILEHPSIGGSLFHAGWGSVIETLQFGHSMVVLPLIIDQGLNARLMVEKGLAIEAERSEDGSFSRDDIAKALKQAMVSKEGDEMRARLREAAKMAGHQKLHDGDEHEDTKEGFLGTPTDRSDTLGPEPFDWIHKINGETFSSIMPLESVTPFGQRKSKFVVQSTLNDLPNVENGSCMTRLKTRKHATALVASGLFEEPIDPTVASQKSVFAVGMICCEEEGRLKEKPVLLQSSLIIAAGPFTTTDNLFFEPLTELLAYAQRKQPQLLLLLVPFIDSEHPEIKKGAVNRTFDEIFRLEILGRYMGSAARVTLVPSIRDANHDFVFPQPAFDIQQADLKHQIKVGCCTVDILKQLSGEEISRNPSGGSKQRMNRLANHLLSQHSFCPLYPPMEDTPVDFSLAPEALQIPCNLDILILSSDLAHFVKVLSIGDKNDGEEQAKCICVNPGRLARGEGAGFFVELNYGGSPDSTSASVISIWTLNYRV